MNNGYEGELVRRERAARSSCCLGVDSAARRLRRCAIMPTATASPRRRRCGFLASRRGSQPAPPGAGVATLGLAPASRAFARSGRADCRPDPGQGPGRGLGGGARIAEDAPDARPRRGGAEFRGVLQSGDCGLRRSASAVSLQSYAPGRDRPRRAIQAAAPLHRPGGTGDRGDRRERQITEAERAPGKGRRNRLLGDLVRPVHGDGACTSENWSSGWRTGRSSSWASTPTRRGRWPGRPWRRTG